MANYNTIDAQDRKIHVHDDYKLLGVESDEKVKRVYFKCPRYVEETDLSTMSLYINYQNANGEKNSYLIDDVIVNDDELMFSWLLSRQVTMYIGNVYYIVCAKIVESGEIIKEWNTRPAEGSVREGLEATIEPEEPMYDVIEDLLVRVTSIENLVPEMNDRLSSLEVVCNEKFRELSDIETLIPEQAYADNKLADKDFVNSSINNIAAYYITKDAEGNPFDTKEELVNATAFYSGGQIRTPTRNDYCVVLHDESKIDDVSGIAPTTRYIFTPKYDYSKVIITETGDNIKVLNTEMFCQNNDIYVYGNYSFEYGASIDELMEGGKYGSFFGSLSLGDKHINNIYQNTRTYFEDESSDIILSSLQNILRSREGFVLDYFTGRNHEVCNIFIEDLNGDADGRFPIDIESSWSFQYVVNNTGFTAEQWKAINSGITNTTLNGYIKKTDIANDTDPGLIKTTSQFGTYTTSDGRLACYNRSASSYYSANNNSFLSVGTHKTIQNDYVANGLINNTKQLTQAEQTKILNWLGLKIDDSGYVVTK